LDYSEFDGNLKNLENASTELNIQIVIYSLNGKIAEIKKNRYVNPCVISLLKHDHLGIYCFLYHENYKTLSPKNLNCSSEFFIDEPPKNKVFYLETLATELTKELIDSNVQLDEQDKLALVEHIQLLKSNSLAAYDLEKLMQPLLK
jgi:hypothetical protein